MSKTTIRQVDAKFWTEEEDLIIEDLSLTAREVSEKLPNRTEGAVKNRRTLRGLNRISGRESWSDSDIEFLSTNLDKTSYWIAKQLGRTLSSVKSKRLKLNEKRYHCSECGIEIKSAGKYCKEHKRLGKQISYYKNRIKKDKGGNLSTNDINDLLRSNCEYCGEAEAMGIDRVDSSIGYFIDNSVPCCSRCNVMKMESNVDDWISHMVKILEKQNVR